MISDVYLLIGWLPSISSACGVRSQQRWTLKLSSEYWLHFFGFCTDIDWYSIWIRNIPNPKLSNKKHSCMSCCTETPRWSTILRSTNVLHHESKYCFQNHLFLIGPKKQGLKGLKHHVRWGRALTKPSSSWVSSNLLLLLKYLPIFGCHLSPNTVKLLWDKGKSRGLRVNWSFCLLLGQPLKFLQVSWHRDPCKKDYGGHRVADRIRRIKQEKIWVVISFLSQQIWIWNFVLEIWYILTPQCSIHDPPAANTASTRVWKVLQAEMIAASGCSIHSSEIVTFRESRLERGVALTLLMNPLHQK